MKSARARCEIECALVPYRERERARGGERTIGQRAATRNAHQRRYKRIYQKAKNGAEAGRYPRDIYSADTKNLRANFDLLAARSLTIAMTMTIARERERERERERAWRVSTR